MALNLADVRAVVLDMDGVLWRGPDVLPQVPEFFAFLRARSVPYALATNNSTKTVETYIRRLDEIGVPAAPEQVITSSVATAAYIADHYDPATPVYIVGQDGIRHELARYGFREDPDHARLVVVGLDFAVTYDKLRTATLRIRAGADFIGTNGDRTFPVPEGLVPGNGSLLAAIQAATDVEPVIIGKPGAAMFEVAVQRLGVPADQALMIGDRLETDILGAQQARLKTALVLTGITTAEQAQTSDIQADAVYDSLADLLRAWQAVG